MSAQMVLPGVGTSEVEALMQDFTDAGRLNSISVIHKQAYSGGWRNGWFASVGIDYMPVDRDGNHPCVCVGHDLEDPIAALLDALRKAKEHMR